MSVKRTTLILCRILLLIFFLSFEMSCSRSSDELDAMLAGNQAIHLANIKLTGDRPKELRCSDPKTIAYLESCIRKSTRRGAGSSWTYSADLGFDNGNHVKTAIGVSHKTWQIYVQLRDAVLGPHNSDEIAIRIVDIDPDYSPQVRRMTDFLNDPDDSSKPAKSFLEITAGGKIGEEKK